jgi:hypothetical protein
MKNKYSDEQIEGMKNWLIDSKGSIFGIVYRAMLKQNKEPFGKDIDELFSKAEKMRDAVCKNPIAKTLYRDAVNLRETE